MTSLQILRKWDEERNQADEFRPEENEENQVGFGGENENYMVEEDFKSNYRKTIY